MSLRTLVLWRHGETDYNASGRMQGHLDSYLTEVGWNQARFAVPALARFSPDIIVASDLRRATDTATVFSEAMGIPLRIDKRLRETNLGLWQGKTSVEVDDGWPGVRGRWQTDATVTPPGGETRVEVAARAAEVVAELDTGTEETAVLCAHGGLITALTGRLLDLPVANWSQLGGISNCHWTVLARRETSGLSWRLIAYNAGITG
ncbi:histidine phosphatase family protein [Actinokineospora xionganensis]|uniref:Histidine phosphatase family protein n=1 Tax=Actinokineospora xionganensis TaxID=2684470 RepID=A0ABR7LAU5_9PSEU|nr:histidine phosphatase family protein [Actinokineospora xionganensis]MBC6449688.1 histidine phosphatase family protein [Actinokineospora xionganensis]